MDMLWKCGMVALTSMLELWGAIPIGFVLQLPPILTGIFSALGAIASAGIVIYLGGSLRSWLMKRVEKKAGRQSRMGRIWEKYGVIGLGLASPLLTGAPLGAAIGISLGAPPGRLMWWMSIGIVIWSIILTAAVAFGLLQFMPPEQLG
ncbi:small multi-drug export protein [Brevibacillus gelatini]|uniref:Small multi-drug export protein n=1 Tax=Brevibacillus gelatini TaxID=1655277 RepID=A0A3M8B3T0_9BACL|nr:small multi-drug export protein [Brevibacillus gelatini]RNB57990.1 small multi-drug export protein [Brevibacillus gelatini]